jgi:AcrR family transcriptional regulator
MAGARESLLGAAARALAERPWSAVRMVEVAVTAGVSRQTLYNEFGSKDGLARALLVREADRYLDGAGRLLARAAEDARPAPPAERLAALAEWTVTEARTRPLLRALLTGCRSDRFPVPGRATGGREGGELPDAAEVVAAVRDRAYAALERCAPGGAPQDPAALLLHCELAVRLALSQVAAPSPGGAAALVRAALAGPAADRREAPAAPGAVPPRRVPGSGFSAPTPRAEGRSRPRSPG